MGTPAPHLALPIRWDMMEAHLDEAAFLWGQWARALVFPGFTLEKAELRESRLRAHVDGLALGGRPVAELLLVARLVEEDTAVSGTAALALLLQEDARADEAVLDAFTQGEDGPRKGLLRALQLSGAAGRLGASLMRLLEGDAPRVVADTLEVLAFWRVDAGPLLSRLLAHPEPAVCAAALRATRVFPARLDGRGLELGLRSSRPEVREAALEAGLVGGYRAAWAECRRQAAAREAGCGLALWALAVAGGAENHRLVMEVLSDAGLCREALWALGCAGTVEAARACLPLLGQEAVARLAGEAFRAVTGLPLVGAFAMAPPEDEDGPEELAAERELPIPHAAQVEAWWAEHGRSFEPGVRYLSGRPFLQAGVLAELETGPMRRRPALARELAIRTRGAFTVTTDAFAGVQRAQLEAARQAPPHLFTRSPESLARG